MFGFSLTKILFTVVLIAVVWKVFKYLEARGRARLNEDDDRRREPLDRNRPTIEELVPCTVCGTYVPARDAAPCERPDCPYQP